MTTSTLPLPWRSFLSDLLHGIVLVSIVAIAFI
jgi:hypothetical protein